MLTYFPWRARNGGGGGGGFEEKTGTPICKRAEMVIGDENLVQIVRIIIIIIIVSTEINERRWSFFLVENLEN